MRQAAIAWERERDAADALVRQIADAEQLLGLPASPEVGAMSSGSAGPCVAHTTVIRHDPVDPLVAQLHYQAGGVQNIRLLVLVVLEPEPMQYSMPAPPSQQQQWDPTALVAALNQMSMNQGGAPWVMDTGATAHMHSHDGILTFRSPPSSPSVIVGDGNSLSVTGQCLP